MTKRVSMTLIASFALVWLAVAAGAHPGHEHKILGTLTMAASDHVMLKDKDGKEVTVYVNSETKVFKDKEPRKVEDIENGMRVVVTAVTQKENEKEKMMAKTIELGSAPEAKQ